MTSLWRLRRCLSFFPKLIVFLQEILEQVYIAERYLQQFWQRSVPASSLVSQASLKSTSLTVIEGSCVQKRWRSHTPFLPFDQNGLYLAKQCMSIGALLPFSQFNLERILESQKEFKNSCNIKKFYFMNSSLKLQKTCQPQLKQSPLTHFQLLSCSPALRIAILAGSTIYNSRGIEEGKNGIRRAALTVSCQMGKRERRAKVESSKADVYDAILIKNIFCALNGNITFFIPMGNDASLLNRYDIACFFRKQDWLRLSITPRFELWKHRYTHETAEVYILEKTPTVRDMDCYEFRSKHNELVKVYFIDINQTAALCDTNNHIKLLVEHIPYKLTDMANLSQEQGLSVLESALKGFRLIERHFGPVDPREELICFNKQGKTKIWLNKRLQINNIEAQQSHYLGRSSDQATRIKELYCIIQQKTVGGLLPTDAKQQLLSPNISFQEALAIVHRFAHARSLSLSRLVDRAPLESPCKQSSCLKHTRQNTNTSLQTRYNQMPALDLSRNKSLASLPQIQSPMRASQIHYRFDYDPRNRQNRNNFYRTQCLSSDYFFSNLMNLSSNSAMPVTKTSFIDTSPLVFQSPAESSLEPQLTEMTVRQATRKESLIQTIQNEQGSVQDNRPAEPKICESDSPFQEIVVNKSKEEALKQMRCSQEIEEQKIQEQVRQDDQTINRELPVREDPYQHQKETQSMSFEQQQHVCRVTRIESQDFIELTNILPNSTEEKKTQCQEKVIQTNTVFVTPKQPKTEEQDFLDINYLQKSLDKKFKHAQPKAQSSPPDDDMLNIARLEQGLIKFQNSQKNHQKEAANAQLSPEPLATNQLTEQYDQKNVQKGLNSISDNAHGYEYGQPQRTIQVNEMESQLFSSQSYLRNTKPYQSIKTEPNIFEFSFSSFQQPHESTYERKHSYNWRLVEKGSWSNEDLSSSYSNRTYKKYHSKTDIQAKYIKHVKSKEKIAKPMPEAPEEYRQKECPGSANSSLASGKNIGKEVEGKAGQDKRITYEDLRSLLRTDL